MICCYEMRKGRGSCVEPSSLKNFGSMFDAEAIHAQIPSNIEPNYQRTWCNGHKTGHASFLSSYIANLPLVSPMFVLGQIALQGRPQQLADIMTHVVSRRKAIKLLAGAIGLFALLAVNKSLSTVLEWASKWAPGYSHPEAVIGETILTYTKHQSTVNVSLPSPDGSMVLSA